MCRISTHEVKLFFNMQKVDETLWLNREAAILPPSFLVAANVALKLPVFYPDAAEVWFAQGDAQFAIRTITVSKTKLYHAVACLSQDVAAQILDLIHAPPAGNPYEVLKDGLTTLFSLNNYQRFGALVFNLTCCRKIFPTLVL